MKIAKPLFATAVAAAALFLAAPLQAQTVAEEFIYYPSEADEYFFFEETDRKKVASFNSDKMVRVCVDDNKHLVPLKVIHDERSSLIQPGDCLRFEAKEVYLEPAKELSANWVLKAEVDTMKTS